MISPAGQDPGVTTNMFVNFVMFVLSCHISSQVSTNNNSTNKYGPVRGQTNVFMNRLIS